MANETDPDIDDPISTIDIDDPAIDDPDIGGNTAVILQLKSLRILYSAQGRLDKGELRGMSYRDI